jgi:hypothetical protein
MALKYNHVPGQKQDTGAGLSTFANPVKSVRLAGSLLHESEKAAWSPEMLFVDGQALNLLTTHPFSLILFISAETLNPVHSAAKPAPDPV